MDEVLLSAIETLPVYTGKAYRADAGYSHGVDTTAGDVVRFEQNELGNDYGVDDSILKELDQLPASRIVWVASDREYASHFGAEVIEINVGVEPKIIAEDGGGGFLVMVSFKPCTFGTGTDLSSTRTLYLRNRYR